MAPRHLADSRSGNEVLRDHPRVDLIRPPTTTEPSFTSPALRCTHSSVLRVHPASTALENRLDCTNVRDWDCAPGWSPPVKGAQQSQMSKTKSVSCSAESPRRRWSEAQRRPAVVECCNSGFRPRQSRDAPVFTPYCCSGGAVGIARRRTAVPDLSRWRSRSRRPIRRATRARTHGDRAGRRHAGHCRRDGARPGAGAGAGGPEHVGKHFRGLTMYATGTATTRC